jgi:hypothetical protein
MKLPSKTGIIFAANHFVHQGTIASTRKMTTTPTKKETPMKKSILQLLAAVFLAAPVTTQAATILGLALDRSGSISASDFNLQKNAYLSVLADPTVLPTDGSVAIGVYSFGATAVTHFPAAYINGANLPDLLTAISSITQFSSGATALGPVIQLAAADMWSLSGNSSDKHVIDVSTDGFGNTGINQVTARDNALALGIDQINGLLVGSGASSTFVGGTGSFSITVDNFADFETALERKIVREVNPTPEAGSTVALLGCALLGLAYARRRLA